MNDPVFTLPTSGPATYRGKYPARARSVSGGATGLHVELNDGTRLWTAKGADHFADLPRVGADLSAFRARAVPMTAEQYERLREAAELLRTRAGIAGHGRRAELEARVRAMVSAIQPDDSAYAKRNAEARRREILAETSARLAFDPAKPFRVYNRGPWGSCCFDFPALAEARAYLSAQAERRAFATSGAAPAGPHGDSIDPLQSFIVSPDGTETLADLGWTPPAEGERLWNRPAPAVSATPAADAARKQADSDIETGADVAHLKRDEESPRTIDLTPTWAGMGGTFRALIENGNAEGRRTAWAEIGKALELADERNKLAAELARRESAELSDVIQVYEMRGDGCQAAGAIVLRRLPDNDATPFVVHFRNDADSERTGRPCYYFGDYCANLADAWAAFGEKIRRFDPTGTLAA